MTRSVMKHQFSQVPSADIQRSVFDRSHGVKTTFDSDFLVPILVDEALPGDSFNCRLTGFARMATPINPVMDNLFMETFFFAVPVRLVWENWQKFCGEQEEPGDSIDYTPPTTSTASGFAVGTVYDYMGVPTGVPVEVNSLHLRAYNLIWNEWFRDENLQTPAYTRVSDSNDTNTEFPLRKRGKRHDYFTSALPWPQKSPDGDVTLPIGTTAPIIPDPLDNIIWVTSTGGTAKMRLGDSSGNIRYGSGSGYSPSDLGWPSDTNLLADLSAALAPSINELREAFQIQRMQERDARGGTRYTEIVRSHFGVTSPDARLQRPEFLGGGSSPVNVVQVPQTSETSTTPQGNLSAYATATLRGHGFTKSFTEHCLIIGLVNVRADLTYQQGLNRMWSRTTRYDYFWPALARLGEQAILNKEIYADGSANDDLVFGYQERYAEYRYKPSTITGLFRSTATSSLDPWHLSEEFASLPVLGDTFIQGNTPMNRVLAVPSEPDFIFDGYFQYRCARPMPIYGVPGHMDRF